METSVIISSLMELFLSLGLNKDQAEKFGHKDIGVFKEEDMSALESAGVLTVDFVKNTTGCNSVVAARIVNFFAFSNRDGRELIEKFLSSLGEGISIGIPSFHVLREGDSFESFINKIFPGFKEQKEIADPNIFASPLVSPVKDNVIVLRPAATPNPETVREE